MEIRLELEMIMMRLPMIGILNPIESKKTALPIDFLDLLAKNAQIIRTIINIENTTVYANLMATPNEQKYSTPL